MGKAAKKITSGIGQAVGTIATGGLNQTNLFGGKFRQIGNAVADISTLGINRRAGASGSGGAQGVAGGQDPVSLLAQTGGAPLLTNIALGVDSEEALAGYFGIRPQDWPAFKESLSPNDRSAIEGVSGQLRTIQSNTELRNKAVQQVVNDFPNIVQQSVEARKSAGVEFDEVSKQILDQASNQLAAKYAATGGFSSGAFNQGLASKAGEIGLQRLGYMDQRQEFDYNQRLQGLNARLTEANALRGFQQAMLGQGVTQGFSAAQANFDRSQNASAQNANFANQRYMQNQQNQNAMLGAVGGLAGTALGGFFAGPLGASVGAQLGGTQGQFQGSYSQYTNSRGLNPNQYAPTLALRYPRVSTGGY